MVDQYRMTYVRVLNFSVDLISVTVKKGFLAPVIRITWHTALSHLFYKEVVHAVLKTLISLKSLVITVVCLAVLLASLV